MHVGLLTLGDLITDPVTGVRRTPSQRHRNVVEQASFAEACGFDSVHLGEHHGNDYILSSPPVVLAAIAERTTSIKLSNGVALAATLDPVRVAEDYATLDALAPGRVEPCFGRGSIYPHVFQMFGQCETESADRFAENVELVHRIWSSERVTWNGVFRSPLHDVAVHPQPESVPYIWIGTGLSVHSVELAARFGCGLMLPTVVGSWEAFRPVVDRYLEGWERYGHPVEQRRIGCCSHFFVAETSQKARSTWQPRYEAYLEAVIDWQVDSMRRAGKTVRVSPFLSFDVMLDTVAICGSPAEVIDRMCRAREMLQLDTHLVMSDMGGMPDAELFDCIELTGSDVISQLPH